MMQFFCEWCGKPLNGETYIVQAGLHFCSQRHWEMFYDDSVEMRKAEFRWGDEAP
jgi:hypothetical protein